MTRSELLRLARIGADARIKELQDEIDALRQQFSGLKSPTASTGRTSVQAAPARKHNMSAAGRKRIADAAKRRWAAFRKEKEKAKSGS